MRCKCTLNQAHGLFVMNFMNELKGHVGNFDASAHCDFTTYQNHVGSIDGESLAVSRFDCNMLESVLRRY